jgi:hypothetical protein
MFQKYARLDNWAKVVFRDGRIPRSETVIQPRRQVDTEKPLRINNNNNNTIFYFSALHY